MASRLAILAISYIMIFGAIRLPEKTRLRMGLPSYDSIVAMLAVVASFGSGTAYGQHPDLQGIWTTSTLTPLERPVEFANKPTLTPSEAAEYAKKLEQQLNRDRRDGGSETDVGRGYNELFFDRGSALARIGATIPSSLVYDPPNGRIPPLTPETIARLALQRAEARQHPADKASDRSLQERCLVFGAGPPMLPGIYNNNFQIVQTPDTVMIMTEMIHDVRIVRLNGTPHPPPSVRLWLGDSIGHWDGKALVVDTTNFTNKTSFHGSDENLHVIERFTRADAKTLVYEFTVDDPTAFTRSWSARLPLAPSDGPIYEYACHEGNYALRDILAGAREEERKAASHH